MSNKTASDPSRRPKIQTESKTQPPVQKKMMRLRVIGSIDDRMRTEMRGMGDLSAQVEEAIRKTNLATVKLVDFKAEGGTAKDTTVSIDIKLYEKLAAANNTRGASMNVLVNSALAAMFKIPVLLRGRAELLEPVRK